MRVIGDIPHTKCRIQLFSWNGKTLVKFEQGPCEQIYKIDELEINDLDSLRLKIDEPFIDRVLSRFEQMHVDRLLLVE